MKETYKETIINKLFMLAETGIQEAIRFLDEVVQVGESLVRYTHPDQDLNFCKTGLFPTISQNKSSVQAIGIDPGATKKMSSSGYGGGVNKIGRQSLNNLMTGNDAIEKERLAKYQYEWFITQTPDYKGATNGTRRSKEVEGGSSGSGQNISESASYVQENIFFIYRHFLLFHHIFVRKGGKRYYRSYRSGNISSTMIKRIAITSLSLLIFYHHFSCLCL